MGVKQNKIKFFILLETFLCRENFKDSSLKKVQIQIIFLTESLQKKKNEENVDFVGELKSESCILPNACASIKGVCYF